MQHRKRAQKQLACGLTGEARCSLQSVRCHLHLGGPRALGETGAQVPLPRSQLPCRPHYSLGKSTAASLPAPCPHNHIT